MYDPNLTADAVTGWTYLGVTLPKALTKAIDAYEAVRYVEIDDQPWFDAATVTANNAEQKVREFAEELALTLRGTAGSPLAEAKRAAVQVSARAVTNQAGEAVAEIIEALSPAFDDAVIEFVAAVTSLPVELDAEAIISGGTSVLTNYEKASDAATIIHRVAAWVATLTQLPAYAGHEPAGVLKVLAPGTRSELAELHTAHSEQGAADPRVTALGAAFVYAARNGIEFKIHTPRESAELLEDIESQPVQSSVRFLKL